MTRTPTTTTTMTRTPTMTPTPYPRPNVGVTTVPGGPDRLNVTLTARDAACTPNNQLTQVRFESLTNALIELPGNVVLHRAPFTVPLAPGTALADSS